MIDDKKYMRRAIQLALRGEGNVSPNPMVGAVIVCDGKIIGEGYHRKYGSFHAEVNAIASVKDESLLPKSTLYVTLEPCSHYGKTPPCSELIIRKGIKRVVVGILDPFEKVRGRGVKMMQAAGIEVEVGVEEDECMELNHKFITAHTLKRPYVLLKWAQSSDGFIGGIKDGLPTTTIISNNITKMLTHRERSLYDAIMVGSATVNTDNPSLTVRDWIGRNPIRVVLDRQNRINKESVLLNDGGRTLIFTDTIPQSTMPNLKYVKLDSESEPLMQILTNLYRRNIISIMVEGGAKLLNSFIESGIWDEIRVEKGNVEIGEGVHAPKVEHLLLENVEIHLQNRLFRLKRS